MERDVAAVLDQDKAEQIRRTLTGNAETMRWYYLELMRFGFTQAEALELICRLQDAWWKDPTRMKPKPQEP